MQRPMGDLRPDTTGNLWSHIFGKCNKAAKISVRDDYIERYLVRYRNSLPCPHHRKDEPGHVKRGGDGQEEHGVLQMQVNN